MKIKQILIALTALIVLLGATTKIQAAAKTASVSGAWSSTATWGGSAVPVAGDTVTINTGISVTGLGGAQACASIVIQGTGNLTVDNALTLTSTVTVGSSGGPSILTITSSGTLTGVTTLSFAGTTPALTNNGTLTVATTSGTGAVTQGANANLTVSGANSAWGGSVTLTATASGNTVTYSGSSQNPKATAYQNLTLSGSGNFGQSWPTITVNGTCTLGGTETVNNFSGIGFGAIVVNGAAVTANTTVTLSGNLTVTSGSFYAQSGPLTVGGTTAINGGTLQLGNAATFAGDFILSTGTLNNSGNGTVGVAGNFTISGGTFTAGTGVYTFSGTSKTISGTISIPKTTVNGTILNTGTLTVGTTLAGSGTLTQNTNSTLNIGGTSASLTLAASANAPNTVAYNGSGAQTVLSSTYDSLTLSGGNTKTLAAATVVNSTLMIAATTTLADGGFILTAKAGIVNNGTHSGAGKISLSGGSGSHSLTGTGAYQNLELNDANGSSIVSGTSTVNGTLILTSGTLGSGTGALTLGNSAAISRAAGGLSSLTPTFGASVNLTYNNTSATTTGLELPASTTVLNNLTINNTAGVTLNASATLKGTLTLTSGQLITGANILTVISAGTISGGSSSSYVYGTLSRGFAAGSGKSAVFPVGDNSVFAPINLASATVSVAGNLVVSTVNNQNSQGAFSVSGLSQSKYVNRDWTIVAANGYAESAGSLTLNFVPGDIQNGMSTNTDVVGKYSGSTWTKPSVASRGPTGITVSGITAFGDWVIGELPVPTFSGLSSKIISYGSAYVYLSGKLSANAGTAFPVISSMVTASINGHVVGHTFTDGAGDFTIIYNDSSLATDGVGSSPYTITYSFAGDANLVAAASDPSTTLTVNKATLSITANDKIKTYGSTITLDSAVDFTPTGLQNGETIGSVTLTPSGGTAAADSVSGSPYTIIPGAATGGTFDANNYTTITYNPGALTVEPLAVSLTGSQAYDGTTNAPAAILFVANAISGDNVTVASGTAGLADKNVPTQAITSFDALVLGNNPAGNYTLTGASGSVTITPVSISVSSGITANDKVYDGTNTATISVGTVTLPGVLGSDDVSVDTNNYAAVFTSIGADTNISVIVSGLALSGTDAVNYTLTQPAGLLASITPAPLTVDGIAASDKIYDGTTNAVIDVTSAVLAGVIDADTNDVALDTTGAIGAFAGDNVGTNISVVVSGLALSGDAATNYALIQPETLSSITPLVVTVAAVADAKNYDGTTISTGLPTITPALVGSDSATTLSQSFLTRNAGIGNETITPSIVIDDGNGGNNYAITLQNSTAGTIYPLTVSVTAVTNTKIYDGTTSATAVPVLTLGSLQTGDTASFAETYDTKNAGTGKMLIPTGIISDGNNGNNYIVNFVSDSTGVIDPASAIVVASSSKNPSGYKDGITITATAPSDATSTVNFLTNGVLFDVETLSNGSAISLCLTNLPRGTNDLTVEYTGDGNYLGSTNDLAGGQVVTNHPPMASDAIYYRAQGTTLNISTSDLLTNATDSDGDTITLQGVGSGTNGATITTNSTGIVYVPGTGASSNDNDNFTYTVADGFGGNATASISVIVYNAAPAQIMMLGGGVVNIQFSGIPNYTYVVETATNLNTGWWPLSTNTAGSDGSLPFSDMNATNTQQYYRLAQP